MVLIIQIALAIILAIVLLNYWREVIGVGGVAISIVVGAMLLFFVSYHILEYFQPFKKSIGVAFEVGIPLLFLAFAVWRAFFAKALDVNEVAERLKLLKEIAVFEQKLRGGEGEKFSALTARMRQDARSDPMLNRSHLLLLQARLSGFDGRVSNSEKVLWCCLLFVFLFGVAFESFINV